MYYNFFSFNATGNLIIFRKSLEMLFYFFYFVYNGTQLCLALKYASPMFSKDHICMLIVIVIFYGLDIYNFRIVFREKICCCS